MIFKEIGKYSRAISLVCSPNYIATATGQRAYVYDRATKRQLACFSKLNYAYKPYITPDEKLLIVRGTTHFIWFFSLERMTLLKRYSIKNNRLAQDSGSTLSPDGRFFYYIVYTNDLLCKIIKIDLLTLDVVNQYFTDKKWVMRDIEYIPARQAYLVFGYERPDQAYEAGGKNKGFILWFSGEHSIDMIWPDAPYCDSGQYEANKNQFYVVSGQEQCIRIIDNRGHTLQSIQLEIKRQIRYDDAPRRILYDSQEKILYVVTQAGLFAIDPETGSTLASIDRVCGFHDLRLIGTEIAADAFFGDVIIYRLEKT